MDLKTRNTELCLIEQDDAEFVLSLRQNIELKKHISATDITIAQQKKWIENYKQREAEGLEFYFVIWANQKPFGTVRLYQIDYSKKECIWGSFIIHPLRPKGMTKDALDLSITFAFNLGLEKIILDVRKENYKAIRFYEFCGFTRFDETEIDFFYELIKY